MCVRAQDIDYIIFTGDIVPRAVWSTTKEENIQMIRDTVGQLADAFPYIPIFAAVGNHESSPTNL